MDKSLFLKVVLNNSYLKGLIFYSVHFIHKYIFKKEIYKWHHIINSPYFLAGNGYLEYLKEYHQKLGNRELIISKKLSPLVQIFKGKQLNILKYYIEDLHFDYKSAFGVCYDNVNHYYETRYSHDLLFLAVTMDASIEIIYYLESLSNNEFSWNYADIISLTPFYKDLELLKVFSSKAIEAIRKHDPTPIETERSLLDETIVQSLDCGMLDMVEWLIGLSSFPIEKDKSKYLKAAIRSKDIKVLQYCLQERYEPDHILSKEFLVDYILQCSNMNEPKQTLEKIELLYNLEIGKNFSFYTTRNATRFGLEMVQWFHNRNPIDPSNYNIMDLAATNGKLEILCWLHANGIVACTKEAMHKAIERGYLQVVQWLHSNSTGGCTIYSMNLAAEHGHFQMVQWVHFNRTEGCTTEAMDCAAKNQHYEIFKWLHKNRTEGCTTKAMDYVAMDDKYTKYGDSQLAFLEWLHENRTEGCTTVAMDKAALNGNLEIVKWLHENRTEGCTTEAMDRAVLNGHFEVVKWLHHNRTEGCTAKAMDLAALKGYIDIVKWLHENRTEGCTAEAMELCVEYGHLNVFMWLHENSTEGCTDDTILLAEGNELFEFVDWLKINRTEFQYLNNK